ncbi:MAG: glycosyl transferase [Sarcina ventriculi]|nr:glycosyl transferase [Sarcina ventriculi]
MKNILIVNISAHGHVNPTIKLVKDLISFGNKVTYYSTEDFREKIEGAGATFKSYEYKEIKGKDGGRGDEKTLISNMVNLADAVLSEVLKETQKFDCLIYNSVLSVGKNIAEKLNIEKTISFYTTFAFSKDMVNMFAKNTNASNNNVDFRKMLASFEEATQDINKKYDIKVKNMIETMINSEADLNLVFTSKYYQPFAQEFDDKFIFVGPSLTERTEQIDFKLEKDKDKKLIYISLGTIDNQNLDFYKKTFEAYGSMKDVQVVLSVGKKTNISDLGDIPQNFKVYNYVPQLEVLKKTDVFVTHGGMNSSSEALYNNIPLVIVPQFGDQFIVGNRVVELGAGILLPAKDATVAKLQEDMNLLLNDSSYKENAIKLGQSLRTASSNSISIYKTI